MKKLVLGGLYHITELYPESSHYAHREFYENQRCQVLANLKRRRFNLSVSTGVRHGRVKILTGPFRGRVETLTFFLARKVGDADCTCRAYPFPHKFNQGLCPGEAKCPDES